MTRREPQDGPSPPPIRAGWRRLALAVVILRFAVPLAAIPAIPYLLLNDVSLLVLLRPQKEFLLVGAGQHRYLGQPGLSSLVIAFLPLGLLAVPAFFAVGRMYQSVLRTGDGPRWLHRAIPPRQLEVAQRVIARRGPTIAVLGRLAAMPSTVLAAAAGVSDVSWRRYLVADAVGALTSVALTLAAGYALGRTYERGGVWLTLAGVTLFVVVVGLLTHWIRRESRREDP